MQVSTQMGPFSIVPEWVLDRDLSSTALKLYIVLARYADWDTQMAFPSRETLAQRMGVSEKTVDRSVTELVEKNCIEKISRGRYASALYKVFQVDPLGSDVAEETKMSDEETKMSRERTNLSKREDKNVHLTITNERYPLERELLNEGTKPARETRLPPDWYPNDRLLGMFDSKWPDLDRDFHIEDFLLYWHSSTGKKTNWDVAFQRWMNSEQKKVVDRRSRQGYRESEKERSKRELDAWVAEQMEKGE